MYVTNVPIGRLFRKRLAPVGDGGYAGLVFLICRAADDPDVHLAFLHDWTSTHDLTGRYLAVITPMPDGRVMVGRGPGTASLVPGIALAGDRERLLASSVRATPLADESHIADGFLVSPTMPFDQEEHEDAVSNAATELQEFFGVSESLLPCAVLVDPQDRTVYVVELGSYATAYRLLKLIKVSLEPETVRIAQAEAELEDATLAWKRARSHRQAVDGYLQERYWQRANVANELAACAASADGESAGRCRWMSERLRDRSPLSAEEKARADQLDVDLMRGHTGLTSRRGRSLARRLRKSIANLDNEAANGVVQYEPAAAQEAVEAERIAHDRMAAKESDLQTASSRVRIGPAVADAARQLGLCRSDSAGLLAWRRVSWPVTAYVRPDHDGPALRFGRS